MLVLSEGLKGIASVVLVEKLKAIPTSPWRMFHGVGITVQDIGNLMDALNVHPKPFRVKSGKDTKQAILRGYSRTDLMAAAKLTGLK
jgi:hypothetical protein